MENNGQIGKNKERDIYASLNLRQRGKDMMKRNKQLYKNIFLVELFCFFLLLPSCSIKTFIAKNKTVEYCYYYRWKDETKEQGLKEAMTLFQDNTFSIESESLDLGGKILLKSEGIYKKRGCFLTLTCYEPIEVKEVNDTTINGYLFIVTDKGTGNPFERCLFILNYNPFENESDTFLTRTIETNDLGTCTYDSLIKLRSFYIYAMIKNEEKGNIYSKKEYIVKNLNANVFKISVDSQILGYYYFSNRRFFILNRNTLVLKEYGKYRYFKRIKGNVPHGAK